jgi:rare lipoprotein A
MFSVALGSSSRIVGATRIVNFRHGVAWAILAAAMLAGCAQNSVTTGKFASSSVSQQKPSESHFKTASFSSRSHAGSANAQSHERPKETQTVSSGLASSYGEGSETASGETFNPKELTAAHRTLPFGTRVRVTNHSNGRSVVVTINDRGPFVSGRIIDVTPAAAHALGMSGLAPVTIERE